MIRTVNKIFISKIIEIYEYCEHENTPWADIKPYFPGLFWVYWKIQNDITSRNVSSIAENFFRSKEDFSRCRLEGTWNSMGAVQSMCVLVKVHVYCDLRGVSLFLSLSNAAFWLSDEIFQSEDEIEIRTLMKSGGFTRFRVNIHTHVQARLLLLIRFRSWGRKGYIWTILKTKSTLCKISIQYRWSIEIEDDLWFRILAMFFSHDPSCQNHTYVFCTLPANFFSLLPRACSI